MKLIYKSLKYILVVQILVAIMPIFVFRANAEEIPSGWESYLERPDILSVQPVEINDHTNWRKL